MYSESTSEGMRLCSPCLALLLHLLQGVFYINHAKQPCDAKWQVHRASLDFATYF